MTTLDLRTVRLPPGEQFRDRIAVVLEPLELGGQRYEASPSAPEAELSITRVSSGTMFELALATVLRGPCYRCLADAEVAVRIRDRQYQATSSDSDDTWVPNLVENRLDLSGWARDAIALAVPEKILCRAGCTGLCAGCGADLNVGPCRCGPARADVRWSKLSELRDRLEA